MSLYELLRDCLLGDQPVALATVVGVGMGHPPEGPGTGEPVTDEDAGGASGRGASAGPEVRPGLPRLGAKLLVRPGRAASGSLGDPDLDRVVARDALGALDSGVGAVRHYGPRGEARQSEVAVFVEPFVPPPQMLIFGAVDFTASLARVAKILGFRVTVCDARPPFATKARFPMADEVVVDWPHRYLAAVGAALGPRDAVCVLTHDSKFDVPAITAALATGAGYIGAMGSRRTHADRTRRLLDAGVSEADLARVMAPIGLDIGARSPEETAVSICAEVIATRTGRAVPSLSRAEGPIHGAGPGS